MPNKTSNNKANAAKSVAKPAAKSAPRPPSKASINAVRKAMTSRRSVRRFTDETIPEDIVQDCLDLALLAPNSSNLQMWNFYRVSSPKAKQALVDACLGQMAAKSAAELIVCTGNTKNWRKHSRDILEQWPQENIPKIVNDYYSKLTYVQYATVPIDPFGVVGLAKKTLRDLVGLAQPMMRSPNDEKDMQLWAAKSVALACENMMLAFRAYGYDTCPMEGFDEKRVRKICGYGYEEFTVMIIAAGRQHEKGIYHDQLRFDRERFIHEI